MKKLLTLPILLLSTTLCFAQLPKDTTKTVPVHYNELVNINQQFSKAIQILYKLDIPALKRDTIESNLMGVFNFLNRRAQTIYADTSKKGKKP